MSSEGFEISLDVVYPPDAAARQRRDKLPGTQAHIYTRPHSKGIEPIEGSWNREW